MSVQYEILGEKCPYCQKLVEVKWVPGGGVLSDPNYCLIADWVYHSSCWDEQIEKFPPDVYNQETELDIHRP